MTHLATPTATETVTCPITGATMSASEWAALNGELSHVVEAEVSTEATSAPTLSVPDAPTVDTVDSGSEGTTSDGIESSAPTGGAALGIFYDPLSYATYDHPYDVYKILRDKAPVYYNERRDLWVVSRYADVRAGLKDHVTFSSARGNDMDGTHESYGGGNLIMVDPPEHTALRSSVRRTFAMRELLAREDGLRATARQLLDELKENGGGNFALEVALPMAINTATKLIGMPDEDDEMLQEHLLRSMARNVGLYGVPSDASASNIEAEEHIAEVIEARAAAIEAGAPTTTSDAITQVLLGTAKGKVEQQHQPGLTHLFISAAIDAPSALLTNIVAVLDKFPAYYAYLRENPDRIPAFVEEVLRYDAPGQNLCRQSTADATFSGVTIPAGSRVMFITASANRDDRVYDDPDFFNIDREVTPQTKMLTFGDGIHACLGAPLARLAGKVLLEELVKGPELRIVGTCERWVKQLVRGFSDQPVIFVTDELREH